MSSSTRISVSNPTQPVVRVNDAGGVNITVAYQSGTGSGGTGDVVGPVSSTDNAIVRFDGTTGKLIQDSGITIADGATGTLSGTNTGNVTLGTANGLSLSSQVLSLATASGSTTGALTSTDWTTFNSKQAALTLGNLTSGTTGVSITGGTGAVVGSGTALSIQTASGSQPGLLSSADWTTFNSKQAALTLGTGVETALAVNVGSSGAFVTNGGALGTPSSGTLTSCTGLPISTGVSGLGTNVATSLANNMSASGTLAILGANTFTGAQTITAGSLTTAALSSLQTWNSGGTTCRGVEISNTVTAAAAASTHLRVLGGAGGATNRLVVTEEKVTITGTEATGRVLDLVSSFGTGYLTVTGGGTMFFTGGAYAVGTTGELRGAQVGNSSNFCGILYDSGSSLAVIRPSTSTLQIGAGAASPTAYTIRGASSRAGTDTNAAGASLTLAAGNGTGTGGGGSLIFQTAPAGSSGSTANTYATRLQITNAGAIGLYGVTPVARATTAGSASTFTANTSGILNDTGTWGGYTIGQVVKALIDIGILT